MSREKLPEYIFGMIPLIHKKLLKRRPDSVIPWQQMNVLHKIKFHPGNPMSYYCAKTMISKPNLTKVVNNLIEVGYLTRKRDEEDRRIVTLHPTDKGIMLVKEYFDDMGKEMIETTKDLSDGEIEELIRSFESIQSIFSKLDNDDFDDEHRR